MRKLIFVLAVCLIPSFCGANISGPIVTTTPIPASLTDWSSSLAFEKFNPTLGTLDMVQIDLSGSMSTVLTVINSSPTASQGNAKTETTITVQDAGGFLSGLELDLISTAYSYSLDAGQSVSSGMLIRNGTSSDQYTAAAILSEFTGTGTIILPASTFTQTLLANTGGNTAAAQVTNVQLTGTVTYFYTVPEPATMALLGLGGLFLSKRKK